ARSPPAGLPAAVARALSRGAGAPPRDERDPARPALHVVLALAHGQAAAAAVEHTLCHRHGQLADELGMVGEHQPARTGVEKEGGVLHPGVEPELLEGLRTI